MLLTLCRVLLTLCGLLLALNRMMLAFCRVLLTNHRRLLVTDLLLLLLRLTGPWGGWIRLLTWLGLLGLLLLLNIQLLLLRLNREVLNPVLLGMAVRWLEGSELLAWVLWVVLIMLSMVLLPRVQLVHLVVLLPRLRMMLGNLDQFLADIFYVLWSQNHCSLSFGAFPLSLPASCSIVPLLS